MTMRMRCGALGAVVFFVGAGNLAAQDGQREARIQRAMSAALPFVSAEATILELGGEVLRPGTNGWTCVPALGSEVPACLDAVWMRLVDAQVNRKPFSTDSVGISYMLQPEAVRTNNADPFDTTEDPGEVWVQEGPHLMFIFPDHRTLDAFPTDPKAGGAYVMWKGTPYAHVMVPIRVTPRAIP